MFKSKSLTLLLLLGLLSVVAIGCSDDDDTVTGGDVNDLIGTWVMHSVTVNGTPEVMSEWFDWDVNAVRSDLIISLGYTYSASEYDASDGVLYTESGTWEIDNNFLIVWVESENGSPVTREQVFNGTWAVSGSTLTLTGLFAGDTVVITYVHDN